MYENDTHLTLSGWKKEDEVLSFDWTDSNNVHSSYSHTEEEAKNLGLSKIWGCGKSTWALQVSDYVPAEPRSTIKNSQDLTVSEVHKDLGPHVLRYQRKLDNMGLSHKYKILRCERRETRRGKGYLVLHFLIEDTRQLMSYHAGRFISLLQDNPNYTFTDKFGEKGGLATRLKYQKRLEAIGLGDRYKILSVPAVIKTDKGGSYYRLHINDTKRGLQFEALSNSVFFLLKKNPDHNFRPITKAEAPVNSIIRESPPKVQKSGKTKGNCEPKNLPPLLKRWAEGEKLSVLSKEVGIASKNMAKYLELPKRGTSEFYAKKLSVLDPTSTLVGMSMTLTKSGNKQVSLTVRDGAGEEKTELSGELFSRLRLTCGQSSNDLTSRWESGESLSSIAESEGRSRGRLAKELGLPDAYSHDYFARRLAQASTRFTLVSVQNSDSSSDKILTLREEGRGDFQLPASWVFKCLSEDPSYIFFPTHEENMERRAANGTSTLIDGVSMREYAKRIGSSYATVNVAVNRVGAEDAKSHLEDFSASSSVLESTVSSWLEVMDVPHIRNKKVSGTSYLPDIRIDDPKIIIECDGLYWHSDAKQSDKNYHKKKREAYLSQGYRPFFFREDEILKSPEICKNILINSLGNNKRVFARKTSIIEEGRSFIKENHLMGKGAGRCFSLVYDTEILSSIQVRCLSKEKNSWDVSRFCSKPGTTVVGGFSKLIKHVERVLSPSRLQTFIDLRYGSGSYLSSLGWSPTRTYLSFRWTDTQGSTFHRMKYPGSTGYEKGMFKIWDCGQAKWEKNY